MAHLPTRLGSDIAARSNSTRRACCCSSVTGPLIAWLLHRGLSAAPTWPRWPAHVSVDRGSSSRPPARATTAELAPLTQALESVLQRLERSFIQQRTFVSDAAHELKTAVAVVKSSLQLLGMRPRTPEEYQAGNERASPTPRASKNLLPGCSPWPASKAEPQARADGKCDLNQCVSQTVAELETFAVVRQVELAVRGSAGEITCTVPLSAEDCKLADLQPPDERHPAQPAARAGRACASPH